MGGTNVSQTSTPSVNNAPVSGNIGAGAVLNNATVMPVDLAGASNNTLSITDVSPAVYAAATATANKSLEAVELVTSGALNLATSQAARAADLAAGSTGSGPYQGLISTFGKYALGALGIVAIVFGLFFAFGKKKDTRAPNGG